MYRLITTSPLGSLHCTARHPGRRFLSVLRQTFNDGDYVWLRPLDGGRPHWRAVSEGRMIYTSKGLVTPDAVIGSESGNVVRSNEDKLLRLTAPTLSEHVRYTERLIYPADASDIVSLLDLHVQGSTEQEPGKPELEILEAGTGHGSLAMYLAQRLQAANPAVPPAVFYEARKQARGEAELSLPALEHYKSRRRAVLHTVEKRTEVSVHARKVIASFRGALYAPHIDMYTGDVSSWLEARLDAQGVDAHGAKLPFLRHVLFDLDDALHCTELATPAVHPDGTILTFCPSISQVQDLVQLVRDQKLPLVLDRVLELSSHTSGGRDWDVRVATIRSSLKANGTDEAGVEAAAHLEPDEHDTASAESSDQDLDSSSEQSEPPQIDPTSAEFAEGATGRGVRYAMVSRPKLLGLHMRGAFIAVLRKRWPDETGAALLRDSWSGSAARARSKRQKKLGSRKKA